MTSISVERKTNYDGSAPLRLSASINGGGFTDCPEGIVVLVKEIVPSA